jgi:hypothetical protein
LKPGMLVAETKLLPPDAQLRRAQNPSKYG